MAPIHAWALAVLLDPAELLYQLCLIGKGKIVRLGRIKQGAQLVMAAL